MMLNAENLCNEMMLERKEDTTPNCIGGKRVISLKSLDSKFLELINCPSNLTIDYSYEYEPQLVLEPIDDNEFNVSVCDYSLDYPVVFTKIIDFSRCVNFVSCLLQENIEIETM